MKILCSNGVKSVMLEILPACERKSGARIETVWGSTMGLQKDIAAGADGDLADGRPALGNDELRLHGVADAEPGEHGRKIDAALAGF